MAEILCICLSSTLQRSVGFSELKTASVNRSTHYSQYASGKAINSARVLNQLKKNSAVSICPVGKENAFLFYQLAFRDNIPLRTVKISGFTRECWTLLNKKDDSTTELVVSEPVAELCQSQRQKNEAKLFKLITHQLKKCSGVLLAGSRPEIWSKDLYSRIAELCITKGKFFLADYIGMDLKNTLEKTIPSVIKINDEEFCKTFGLLQGNDKFLKNEIISKSRQLQNMIVVTRGTKSTFAADRGNFVEVQTEKVKAVNTTACGDSFNAGFMFEYLESGNFTKALEKGCWCASRNAELEAPGAIY